MKERVEILVDSFEDEAGVHNFVLAALSVDLKYGDMWATEGSLIDLDFNKGLKLGFAICSPSDKFDKDLGIEIATGRARKNKNYALVSTKPGYINRKLIQSFLVNEATFFKENPDYYIAGYKRMKNE
jgi:hypothetical protein